MTSCKGDWGILWRRALGVGYKSVTEARRDWVGSENVHTCVTSFMNGPFQVTCSYDKKSTAYARLQKRWKWFFPDQKLCRCTSSKLNRHFRHPRVLRGPCRTSVWDSRWPSHRSTVCQACHGIRPHQTYGCGNPATNYFVPVLPNFRFYLPFLWTWQFF